MLTLPAPIGPVNPAEVPVAAAVLEAACFELHPPQNYNPLFQMLSTRHPQLSEEIHYLMRPEDRGAQALMAIAR